MHYRIHRAMFPSRQPAVVRPARQHTDGWQLSRFSLVLSRIRAQRRRYRAVVKPGLLPGTMTCGPSAQIYGKRQGVGGARMIPAAQVHPRVARTHPLITRDGSAHVLLLTKSSLINRDFNMSRQRNKSRPLPASSPRVLSPRPLPAFSPRFQGRHLHIFYFFFLFLSGAIHHL